MTFVDSRKAWILAVSGCLLMFVSSGNIRTNGVLFVALMEAENLSRGPASWPFNLPGASTIIAAPLTGIMNARYSTTVVSLVASVLFVLGQLPCYFTTDIYSMSVFYGLVRGFGVSMHSTLVPLVTSTSFKFHRSTAMGLCMMGAPLGGIVMPLLAQFLVLEYDLKGTILLLTGVSMHAFVFSLAYMWYDDPNKSKETPKKISVKTDNERTPLLSNSQSRYDERSYEKQSSAVVLSKDEKEPNEEDIRCNDRKETEQEAVIYEKEGEGTSTKDVKPSLPKNELTSKRSTKEILKNIFTNRGFCFATANQMVGACANHIVTQVIIDYAIDKGIGELMGVYLVTCSSAGDIVGKLCLGFIPDKNILSIYNHVALFQMISAGMAILLTFSNDFFILMVIAFVFGASQGTCLSSNFVQVVDYVATDEIPLAVAVIKAFTGLAFFSLPSLIGLFRDNLGSYDKLFYLVCAGQLLFTFVWLIEGIINSIKKRNKMDLVK